MKSNVTQDGGAFTSSLSPFICKITLMERQKLLL